MFTYATTNSNKIETWKKREEEEKRTGGRNMWRITGVDTWLSPLQYSLAWAALAVAVR